MTGHYQRCGQLVGEVGAVESVREPVLAVIESPSGMTLGVGPGRGPDDRAGRCGAGRGR